jgi:hypothetical protein
VEEGDPIRFDIPQRRVELLVSEQVLAQRRERMEALGAEAWQPSKRRRTVSGDAAGLRGVDDECRPWRCTRRDAGAARLIHYPCRYMDSCPSGQG